MNECECDCGCGCGEMTSRRIRLLREEDRASAQALGWAEWSIGPAREWVWVAPGHEKWLEDYMTRDEEG